MFQLPDSFATDYQGSGGSSNTAGVKIQLEYDLLSGQFLNVQLGPGKNNDKTYGTICLETVEAGDLCLRDLVILIYETYKPFMIKKLTISHG